MFSIKLLSFGAMCFLGFIWSWKHAVKALMSQCHPTDLFSHLPLHESSLLHTLLACASLRGQKVPSLVSKAFDDMNETILAANLEFNISIDKYRAATHDFQTAPWRPVVMSIMLLRFCKVWKGDESITLSKTQCIHDPFLWTFKFLEGPAVWIEHFLESAICIHLQSWVGSL